MAKYKVEQFSRILKDNGKGYPNLFIFCKLLNENGNPSIREYRIAPDVRHPDLNILVEAITTGFNQAIESGAWVEISEYEERMYIFLTLPTATGKEQIQVSGECCYVLQPAVLKTNYPTL
ncbi:TPA: hypothetical protein ACP31Q_003823 [Pseudomonas aeruginosa]